MGWLLDHLGCSRSKRYVAVRVSVAEANNSREASILRLISSSHGYRHKGEEHIVQILDSFHIEGPNGKHQCLVLELLGPNIPEVIDIYLRDEILPAQAARSIAYQGLMGVDFLAQLDVGHADIHTRNLVLTLPHLDSLNEQQFIDALGQPELGRVQRIDSSALEKNLPSYIVRPTAFKAKEVLRSLQAPIIKIIDFGESFLPSKPPVKPNTPLVFRPPEVLFGDPIDSRVDLWSLGCLLLELFTSQPPFDNYFLPPTLLISYMIEFSTEGLPDRWKANWQTMRKE